MTITRTIRTGLAVAVAAAGLASTTTPASAFQSAGSFSTGTPERQVAWDHAAWKKCWAITYAQWREDGASPNVASTAADLTCGEAP